MNYLICASYLISFCLVVAADICDVCACNDVESDPFSDNENDDSLFRLNCLNLTETKLGSTNVDLENIQWPNIKKSLEAHFNYMKFNHLPKLLGSALVKIINLDNNLIETIKSDPFKQCKNLESLSISNNSIHDLPKGIEANAIMISHR